MKPSLSRSAAASSLLLLVLALAAHASSRPRYGGTVRVLLHDRVNSVEPAGEEDHPAARDRIASLIFETLTSMDQQGHARPLLAESWNSDAAKRVWEFHLRMADFQDGTPLAAADAAASLSKNSFGWKASAPDRQTVTIESPTPVPHLPEMLAQPKFAISKRLADNTLSGTGPFKLSQWQGGERAALAANEDYWGGRPYLDAMEFELGSSLHDQLLQRQLGPYGAAELTMDQVRGLEQGNQQLAISRPADLLVVVFTQTGSAATRGPVRQPVDPRVREAFANAVNRAAISNVLLQKRGLPASGLLPQWFTGYEFLFPPLDNLEHARELRADTAALVIIPPVSLAYDYSDPVAKMVAERIAVDAREAGLVVQPYGESHVNSVAARASLHADAVLLRLPLPSLEPSVALASLLEELGAPPESVTAALQATRPEELFEIERKALQDFHIVPVAHASEAVWLNTNLHNWQQAPTGAWDLNQLWVEGAR